ncbi:MAG: hypothetical protein K9N62_16795 [Verrucomicrobia bacterium]|nr:hypothetical protein [Verrucomicrobiota bacterium]
MPSLGTVDGQPTAQLIMLEVPCVCCTGQIGDFVWNDLNGDGCQDPGEPGIPNVQVDLYAACGVGGTLIGTTTTDSTGHYLFTDLCAGTYTVSFHTPEGYAHTVAHSGCVDSNNPPYSNQTDSKCDCPDGSSCGVCVELTLNNPINLNVDCGYIVRPPKMELLKSAAPSFVLPGGQVTYTYEVKNTGGVTINNIVAVDDNGTPNDPGDDILVGTVTSLAPGTSQIFTYTTPPLPQQFCQVINNQNILVGTLHVTDLGAAIQVTYVQANVNDNRYGTGATAATGWTEHRHNFNDLVGSDKAEFVFRDGLGNVVLDFTCDYITASGAFLSGYGCLGVKGGDGKMFVGNAADVLLATTSLSDNLNGVGNAGSPFVSGYLVNSPPETSPLSGVSVPAGWDYFNRYTVVVSQNAFGANGYGGVTVPAVHNSPPKIGGNLVTPSPCQTCVINTGNAIGTAEDGTVVEAYDLEEVCFGTPPSAQVCNLAVGALKFDKNKVQLPIKNAGTQDVFLSEVTLAWPSANGGLKKISLNHDVWKAPAVDSPIDFNITDFDAFNTDTNTRRIEKGKTKTLVFEFEHDVDKDATHYSAGTARFGADDSCVIVFLP